MGRWRYRLVESFSYSFLFILILWLVKSTEIFFHISFAQFGILPRHIIGLPGIIIAPLIHGDPYHLFSNTVPLFILGNAIIYFYRNIAFPVFFLIYFFSDLAVWCVASGKGYHIGASGLIYGFVSFLFFSGIFRHDKKSMILSIIIVFVYGGLIWGMLPIYDGISWESHFFGSLSGGACAYIFRKKETVVNQILLLQKENPKRDKNDMPNQ